MSGSDFEAEFFRWLELLAPELLPDSCREYVFHPSRKWRFDLAFPAALLAIEIDGGQWLAGGGRHNRDSDREKLNQAAAQGWRVLRFSGAMIRRDPAGCIELTREALAVSGNEGLEIKARRGAAAVAVVS